MIVADTNVVSELMRLEPDPQVLAWAEGLAPGAVAITVITVEEIERGLARLPDGRRRRDLTASWRRTLGAHLDDVLVYDSTAARATAAILVDQEQAGRGMGLADAQIAGICVSRGWPLATRNTKDFAEVRDLVVLDPFRPEGAAVSR